MKHLKRFLEFINNNFNTIIIKLHIKENNNKMVNINESNKTLGPNGTNENIIIKLDLSTNIDENEVYINKKLQ